MHVALPSTNNSLPRAHHHSSSGAAHNNTSGQKQELSLQDRIKAANRELALYEIRSKEQSLIPSNTKKINDIKAKYNLQPRDIEMHFHKQKDPNTNEVMLDPKTGEPLRIAELVNKDHKCGHDHHDLHKPAAADHQKKTSICTGPQCKPPLEQLGDFFRSLFSIAA